MSDSTGAPQSQNGIFAAFHELTLKGLEQSLLDAQARYERGEAQADPTPSLNWAVTNQAMPDESGAAPSLETLLQEEVILWLSVGDEKLEIVPGSDHATIQASALINALKEMRTMVQGLARTGLQSWLCSFTTLRSPRRNRPPHPRMRANQPGSTTPLSIATSLYNHPL